MKTSKDCNGVQMNKQDPFYEAYTRYRRFGYSAFFLTLFVGVGGIVLWKWYALPIAVGLGLLCTYIWTKRFYQDLSKRTGIQDMAFLDHMMMSERKKRKGIKVTLPEDLEDLNVEERKSPEIKN